MKSTCVEWLRPPRTDKTAQPPRSVFSSVFHVTRTKKKGVRLFGVFFIFSLPILKFHLYSLVGSSVIRF
jgi:hypothetical protein